MKLEMTSESVELETKIVDEHGPSFRIEELRQVLNSTDLLSAQAERKTFRAWLIGCGKGEEAYALAMCLREGLASDVNVKILATDANSSNIAVASNGVYSATKLNQIPKDLQSSFIDLGRASAKGWFRFTEQLTRNILFKVHDLQDASSPGLNLFDLILVRDGFEENKKIKIFIISKLSNVLVRGGYIQIPFRDEDHSSFGWNQTSERMFRKDF